MESLGIDVLGMNCGGTGTDAGDFAGASGGFLYSRYGQSHFEPSRSENGETVYDIDAEEFAAIMEEIVDMGARIAGGCCGTTPEHIRKVYERCRTKIPVPVIRKRRTVVSSFAQAVEIGKTPVIIGERINPTGKSKFKQALREHNLEYILQGGCTQQENGAHVLDVNVGLPEIDEPSMMEEVVRELHSGSAPAAGHLGSIAMERAMRVYNGKPLINSVNGKRVYEGCISLVKKYGGGVVGSLSG